MLESDVMNRTVTKWQWTGKVCRDRVWKELQGRGYSVFHYPGSAEFAEKDPEKFVYEILRKHPWSHWVEHLKVHGRQDSFVNTRKKIALHTDADSCLPASVLFMIGVEAASMGGENTFIDSWEFLKSVKNKKVLDRLFLTPRIIPFKTGFWLGPTVTLRRGGMIFTHLPFKRRTDPIGSYLVKHFEKSKNFKTVTLNRDDIFIADNYRVLHGRLGFRGKSRDLLRVLAWFNQPVRPFFSKILEKKANEYQKKLSLLIKSEPKWLKERFGFLSKDWDFKPVWPTRNPSMNQMERLFVVFSEIQKHFPKYEKKLFK